MLSTRRPWTWAAGVLLGASTAGMGIAQENTQPPGTPPAGPPAGAPVVSPSSYSWQPGNPPCDVQATAKPSCWERLRHRLQDCFLGYREEYEAPPLGHYLYLHGQTEVANGDAARMVLYHYDFVEGSDQLKPRGQYQLSKIAALLPQIFNPIIIEMTPDAPGLDEARRVAVVQELAKGPFPVPAERVVVGRPIAVPLPGVEATRIYRNLLLNTESGGLRSSAGAGRAGGGGGAIGTTSSGVLAPTGSPGASGPPGP